jgi:G3E family GTPase
MSRIELVPTTVIFGFLGVGKTSAIINLFQQKPSAERWAVLVNEFGQLGIDQHIYQDQGISVKTLSGGCMCCAQGAPLRVAINQLLRESQPHRLLIESSGVGHPDGVLKTLNDEGFRESLQLKAAICLINPQHLLQDRYRNNDLFQQQIQLSDILIANKIDLAEGSALLAFDQLVASLDPPKQCVDSTTLGQMDLRRLDLPRAAANTRFQLPGTQPQAIGPGFRSASFEFDATVRFDMEALTPWLEQLPVIRLKGLLRSAAGSYLINLADDALTITAVNAPPDLHDGSYIEIIAEHIDEAAIQAALQRLSTHR